jgi:diguanylate cyclase (GGDEF)-like protein
MSESTVQNPTEPLPTGALLERLAGVLALTQRNLALEAVLPDLASEAAGLLGAQAVWITLLAPCADQAQVHYFAGPELPPGTELPAYPIAGSPDERFLAADGVLALNPAEFAEHPALRALPDGLLAGVAMQAADQVYGTLKASFAGQDRLAGGQALLLEILGAQAAALTRSHCLQLEARQLMLTDHLTGLLNQSHFMELAMQELRRARRYEHAFSLLLIDIDHFREINENYGHSIGDVVLRGISDLLRENLREVDILGRYGGEEFVLLLPETGLNEALGVAGRLLYTLRATPIDTSAGQVRVTVSIGISGQLGSEELTLDRLLDRADRALYQSKKNGRNRVTVWVED